MKPNYFHKIIIAVITVMSALAININEAKAACLPQYTRTVIMEYVNPANGCTATVTFTYCLEEYQFGELRMHFSGIKFCSDCPPELIFGSNMVDAMIFGAANTDDFKTIIDSVGRRVPICPDVLCFFRIMDRICSGGWQVVGSDSYGRKCYEMIPCGSYEPASCNEVVTICFHKKPDGTLTPEIQRVGQGAPPPCPEGCTSSCGNQ